LLLAQKPQQRCGCHLVADAVVAGTMVAAVDTVGVVCNASIAAFVAAGIGASGSWQ
jgi:hypothetical protein